MCINKIDRPEARPEDVMDEVLELLLELDADDEQLDSPLFMLLQNLVLRCLN